MNISRNSPDPLAAKEEIAGTAFATLSDLLRYRALHCGNQTAYRFVTEHDDREISLTFGELDQRAQAIAAELSEIVEPGQRALLVFPPGLGFVEALFGCFYAGVLAVPATHPRPHRPMTRIATIATDCKASIVLTTRRTIDGLNLGSPPESLKDVTWIASDEVPVKKADQYVPREIAADDIAFLQYTSGSTNDPKGVIITHANLMSNLEMLRVAFGINRSERDDSTAITVSWLPAFHDMGLIGGILEALYVRECAVLMSPSSFLLRPERWLQTISKHRSSINGAPNFAFDLCVRKIPDEMLKTLDLSCWRVAVSGAEPVRAETIERFVEKFGVCGFREEAFYPCYGLAEATLMASGGDWKQRPRVIRIRRSKLLGENLAEPCDDVHDTQSLVSCGMPILDEKLAILNPRTGIPCKESEVGEIWLSGPNVSRGYWKRTESHEPPVNSKSHGLGEGPYAKTGDLGVCVDGHLYVTGRLKDLLVVHGRNFYSHDIELTVGQSHECLLPGAGAAFSVDNQGEQVLVVVHEVDRAFRSIELDKVLRKIGRRVMEAHDIYPQSIVLIRQASLPRTTSGKVQRHRCCDEYLEGKQKTLASWTKPSTKPTNPVNGHQHPAVMGSPDSRSAQNGHSRPIDPLDQQKLVEQVETNMLQWLSERCEESEHDLDPNLPFAEFGIDSLAAVELSHKLEEWSGVRITETVAWRYPTPSAIVRYIADELAGSQTDRSHCQPEMEQVVESEFERLLASVEQLSDEEATSMATEIDREKTE